MGFTKITLRLEDVSLEKLRSLHRKEGPINPQTKKRRPFNVFLRSILAEHASERMNEIKRKEAIKDWDGDDFE